MKTDRVKFLLDEERIPRSWYNLLADLPSPPPPVLHPGTLKPVGPDDLAPLFPMSLILQEVSTDREVEIPGPVRDVYKQWRPSPLYRARRLERALDTPARIYYKYEGVSPAGSHKPNTAVAQAFYNKQAGIHKIATETGAGQWGSSLALAGAAFGVEIQVFMVRISYNQKPYRRAFMETFGARCIASPSMETHFGRQVLAASPDSNGSLGIAISEAVEVAATRDDTNYALGSVLNHVLLHQTVIGQEAMAQMEMAGDYPDVVIGGTGGGSNFAGLAFPFIGAQLPSCRRAFTRAACATTAWRRWRNSLEKACRLHEVDLAGILAELKNLQPATEPTIAGDPVELVTHIINQHHSYVRHAIPSIRRHLSKVIGAHGARHPELSAVARNFNHVADELMLHLMKEEQVLFPYIRALAQSIEHGEPPPPDMFGTVQNPIRMLESEHQAMGDELAMIRTSTSNYEPPLDACTTYRLVYAELREFERDLHRHVHLENNVLFPRAVELEAQMSPKLQCEAPLCARDL